MADDTLAGCAVCTRFCEHNDAYGPHISFRTSSTWYGDVGWEIVVAEVFINGFSVTFEIVYTCKNVTH